MNNNRFITIGLQIKGILAKDAFPSLILYLRNLSQSQMISSCLSYIRAVKVLRTHTYTGNFIFLLGKHCSETEMATIFSKAVKGYLLLCAENDYVKKLVWGVHAMRLSHYAPILFTFSKRFSQCGTYSPHIRFGQKNQQMLKCLEAFICVHKSLFLC